MTAPPSTPNLNREQLSHFRHELLTQINHIIGLTEILIDEAPETGLLDFVPAFEEISAGGRSLLAIIQRELAPAGVCDFNRLEGCIESEAGPTLGRSRGLIQQLQALGRASEAEEMQLVSSALEQLASLAHGVVHGHNSAESVEQIRK